LATGTLTVMATLILIAGVFALRKMKVV